MSSPSVLACLGLSALILVCLFVAYLLIRYTPIVMRIFEEAPLFLPLRAAPAAGEDVRFRTRDGLELAGTYLRARTAERAGVVVFCHEFLGNRWSVGAYADCLRDLGFDLFTFDFRNHGESAKEAGYEPLQWVSNREVRDLRAALAYLRSRPDADPAGVGLLGISRGGGTALCVMGKDPRVWGLATDGAFPTRGTVAAYIRRWAMIYVGDRFYAHYIPRWAYDLVSLSALVRTEWRRGCRYADVERAVGRLGPRPWLMIHGEKDAYIPTDIARRLFALAPPDGKELWVVPGAKHNRSREADPAGYRGRLGQFFRRIAPRRPVVVGAAAAGGVVPAVDPAAPVSTPIPTPIPH